MSGSHCAIRCRFVTTALRTPGGEPALAQFLHRVNLMKKAHDRFSSMFDARDAPTIFNVWRRM